MKKTFHTLLLAAALAVLHLTARAQTLHAIVFCNTIDQSIGKSMQVELDNVTNKIETICALLDYDKDIHRIDGPNCTKKNLKEVIDEMDVEENDVVLTFYGGHGTHAPNNESDPWPQYCMNTGFEDQDNWVPMAALARWVQEKKPRLAVILSNCCNVIQGSTTIKPLWAMGGDYTSLDGVNAENYKKLFAGKGLVMATSSKVPEPSWCNAVAGGLFTCDLIESLDMMGKGTLAPDWNSVLQKAYDLCAARDIVSRDGHHKQHPYFRVNAGQTDGGGGKAPRTDDRPRKDTNPLGQALLNIVDKRQEPAERLAMIPAILGRHFGNISKVMTVGSDLKTAVDYEDPQDFLRRICLSPYIVQVNIIGVEDGILTVHEVRNR